MQKTIHQSVFKELLEAPWGKAPKLFKAACSETFFSPEMLFGILKKQSIRVRNYQSADVSIYNSDAICLSAMRHGKRSNTGIQSLLTADQEVNLDNYLNKLLQKPGYEEFSIVLDYPFKYSADLWKATRDFIAQLSEWVPISEYGIETDAFIGNYLQTPFGVHKDDIHNFMFMVKGQRKMHFWPDDPKTGKADQKNKVSFQLQPGDLLYWPPRYWHTGENLGLSASVNINYLAPKRSLKWVDRVLGEKLSQQGQHYRKNSFSGKMLAHCFQAIGPSSTLSEEAANVLQDLSEKTIRSLSPQLMSIELLKEQLSFSSRKGLNTAIPKRKSTSISNHKRWTGAPDSPLVIYAYQNRLMQACNGHLYPRSLTKGWQPLCEMVNLAEPFSLSQLRQLVPDADQTEIIEWLDWLWCCYGLRSVKSC